MSPGTRPEAGTSATTPARRNRAVGALAARSASSARSPRYSVMTSAPMIGNSAIRTSRPSRTSPSATASTPATMSRTTNGSVAASKMSFGQRRPRRRARDRSGRTRARGGRPPPATARSRGRPRAPRRPRRRRGRARRPRSRAGEAPFDRRGGRSVRRHRPDHRRTAYDRADANGPRLHPCGPWRRPPRDRLGRRPRDRLRHDDAALALPVRVLSRRGRDARLARQRPDADRRADPAGRRRDGRRLRHRTDLGRRPSHRLLHVHPAARPLPVPDLHGPARVRRPRRREPRSIGSTRHEEHA